ncbi:uncharacterized protein LOC124436971 [Xenia sp. Carnegie-2017]|uniref:uncharacterized protein LOC124436971 n=1 Tax=Xenia sp. Carnegie-2017 TaxID=2897299 RepID=UPI001F03D54F|nr:uncharacterized protein LOC124436971 [Xenia sp. Carnegie-2017]
MNTPLLASFLLIFYPLVVDSSTWFSDKSSSVKDKLKSILDQNYAYLLAGEPKKVLKFYTSDCVLIGQGAAPIVGKAALFKYFKAATSGPRTVSRNSVYIDEIFDKGNIVTLRYTLTPHAKDCRVLFHSRVIIVWKKTKSGKYLIHNLISNVQENLCPSTS